jgi:hypothetical protein
MKSAGAKKIMLAKAQAEAAHLRLSSTMAALQLRLRPSSLANQAWTGVREKSGEIADDAVQAVRERPAVATGAIAAFLLFLAREPILSAASKLMARNGKAEPEPEETDKGSSRQRRDAAVKE